MSEQLCLFDEEVIGPERPIERFEVNLGYGKIKVYPSEQVMDEGLGKLFEYPLHKVQDPNPQYDFAFMHSGAMVARVRRLTG